MKSTSSRLKVETKTAAPSRRGATDKIVASPLESAQSALRRHSEAKSEDPEQSTDQSKDDQPDANFDPAKEDGDQAGDDKDQIGKPEIWDSIR